MKVTIIGAGLSGSLMAIYLAKKGFIVDVYEARGDMRAENVSAGRSINLALSNRGIAALKEVGLDEYMLAEAVPMFGRMIHGLDGSTKLLPYSGRSGEYINSVSRAGLNVALINEAEKYETVKFHFNRKCIGFSDGIAQFDGGSFISADTTIATDGAGSIIREGMVRNITEFEISQTWLEHGYKELHIPPDDNGGFRLEKNALHIWARQSFMMIALPNFDGSFTCTLFLTHSGENGFDQILEDFECGIVDEKKIASKKKILKFFQTSFADAIPLMPTLIEDFQANPIGNLGTLKCYPWNIGGDALLIGDAAHAIVPFYGQGMNASFEDCRILNRLIGEHNADWATIFDEFTRTRKPDTDAIADMAEENFYEMRDRVADTIFQRKRQLETLLEQQFPEYFSKYSMVTFREDLPYSVAKQRGNAQDKLLMEICAEIDNVGELNLDEVLEKVRKS